MWITLQNKLYGNVKVNEITFGQTDINSFLDVICFKTTAVTVQRLIF